VASGFSRKIPRFAVLSGPRTFRLLSVFVYGVGIMVQLDRDVPPLEEPLAGLERRLIDEYIRGLGHDPVALRQRGDAAAKKILTDAAQEAALRLTEIESRSHYVHQLHDGHD
jgi:hypothetical protein